MSSGAYTGRLVRFASDRDEGEALGRFGRAPKDRADSISATLLRKIAREGGRARAQTGGGKRGTARFAGAGASASPWPGGRTQRVTVKALIVKHAGGGSAKLTKHVTYLAREKAGLDGERPEFVANGEAVEKPHALVAGWKKDRHHFRFIISPENAAQMSDLKAYSGRVVERMEEQLGTRLEWIATSHHNTDNPHVHLLVRGVRDDGSDLVMSRQFISHGLRYEAQNLATKELGLRTEAELESDLSKQVKAERFTQLDAQIIRFLDRQQDQDGKARIAHDARHMARLQARIEWLEKRKLIVRDEDGRRSPVASLRPKLQEMGKRSDIIKQLHNGTPEIARRLKVANMQQMGSIAGRIVRTGMHDELTERRFVVVSDSAGNLHYTTVSDEHAKRLKNGDIARMVFHQKDGKTALKITRLSDKPIDDQIDARAQTWLDREINKRAFGEKPSLTYDRETASAIERRMKVLEARGMLTRQGASVRFRSGAMDQLKRREIEEAGRKRARELGKEYVSADAMKGRAITYRETVELHAGRYAVVEDRGRIALVRHGEEKNMKKGMDVEIRPSQRGPRLHAARDRDLSL